MATSLVGAVEVRTVHVALPFGVSPSVAYNPQDGLAYTSRSSRGAEKYASLLFAAPIATTGILAGIAIPNFMKAGSASQRNACMANLRQIEGAYEQAKLSGISDPKPADLYGPKGYIRVEPVCPATKQHYEINAEGIPVCPSGLPGHVLPGAR